MTKPNLDSNLSNQGDYAPPGEANHTGSRFEAQSIAEAFGVNIDRVHAAMSGEFQLAASDTVSSRQAQHLAEVILGDQPLDKREGALLQLGAYTPRADHDTGLGERLGGIESDRLVRNADRNDEERG